MREASIAGRCVWCFCGRLLGCKAPSRAVAGTQSQPAGNPLPWVKLVWQRVCKRCMVDTRTGRGVWFRATHHLSAGVPAPSCTISSSRSLLPPYSLSTEARISCDSANRPCGHEYGGRAMATTLRPCAYLSAVRLPASASPPELLSRLRAGLDSAQKPFPTCPNGQACA